MTKCLMVIRVGPVVIFLRPWRASCENLSEKRARPSQGCPVVPECALCYIGGGGGALGILLQESSRVPPAAYTPRCPPRATLEHPCIPVVALV